MHPTKYAKARRGSAAIGRASKIRTHFNKLVFRRCEDALAQNWDMAGAEDHQDAVASSAGVALEVGKDAQVAIVPGGDPIHAGVGIARTDLEPPSQVLSVACLQGLLGIVAEQRFADGAGQAVMFSVF